MSLCEPFEAGRSAGRPARLERGRTIHSRSGRCAHSVAVHLLAATACLFAGCSRQSRAPVIELTDVPVSDPGGPVHTDSISGRVTGAKPGQQLVLYAYSAAWWVQPTVENPYTPIASDQTWKNTTHLGTEYAALLVEPGYRPQPRIDTLPSVGNGVVAVAVKAGRAHEIVAISSRLIHFKGYETWWFRTSVLLFATLVLAAAYRLRVYQITRQMNARFEERLAERIRIAQELHDTLLQGFLSASMQVDVAEEMLPGDSPAKPLLKRALQLMYQVTEEGRQVIRGLRAPSRESDTIEEMLSRFGHNLAAGNSMEYRVVSQDHSRALRSAIRDEVYRIGREALVNAFKHSRAGKVEVEVVYANSQLRLVVRDNGRGIDSAVLHSGRKDHWGLPGMRERAETMGAALHLRSRAGAGTEVELTIPGAIAYLSGSATRSSFWRRWLSREDSTDHAPMRNNVSG